MTAPFLRDEEHDDRGAAFGMLVLQCESLEGGRKRSVHLRRTVRKSAHSMLIEQIVGYFH
jgi:hypothetical protein